MKRRGFIAALLSGAAAALLPRKAEGEPKSTKTYERPAIKKERTWREAVLWQDDGYCYAVDDLGQLFRSRDSVNWTKVKND